MDQENNFLKFYESLTHEEIEEEINTLNNIKLSVDFWEYIATDPEKLLAIIHYNNLEEKYGIKIVFNKSRNENNDKIHTDETGNMIIIFRFNNDVYHISTMIDSVTNTNIYDSFVEQILFLLNNYRSEIISREEKYLVELEKTIKEKYNCSVNLLWYIMNSPNNIKEIITKIDQEMNKTNCDKKIENTNPTVNNNTTNNTNPNDNTNNEQHINTKFDYCPLLTICYSIVFYFCVLYIGSYNH